MPNGVLLDEGVLERIARVAGESEGNAHFAATFARYRGHHIGWHNVPFLYLSALHAKYSSQSRISPSLQLAQFVRDVTEPNLHLLWFGLLAHDHTSLQAMQEALQKILDRGTKGVVDMYQHFEARHAEEAMIQRSMQSIPAQPPAPLQTREQVNQEVATLLRNARNPRAPQRKVTFADPQDAAVVFSWDAENLQTARPAVDDLNALSFY